MTNRIQTFWLEPTGNHKAWLNRANWDRKCPEHDGCACKASTLIGDVDTPPQNWSDTLGIEKTDPRWPTKCACGYEFTDTDDFFVNSKEYYKRSDTGGVTLLEDAPVGATWHARGYNGHADFTGPDGLSVHCKTPGGTWIIDSRAANCTSPCKHCGVPYASHDQKKCTNPGIEGKPFTKGTYEESRVHKCWIRHGVPSLANLTVDKDGVTCQAGAGSIAQPKWHGFLRRGYLEKC